MRHDKAILFGICYITPYRFSPQQCRNKLMDNYDTWRWVVNQGCRTLLIQNLNGRDCTSRLRENPITRSEAERILSKITSEELVDELLEILILKDEFWVPLLQFLRASNQERIAKQLEEEYRKRETVYSKVENEQTVDPVQDLPNGSCQVGVITYNPQEILGRGSEGTIVFKGKFDEREVAVKRISKDFNNLDREVRLLRISDSHPHPNIIRYFFVEKDIQYRYIALELCKETLEDYVKSDDFQNENCHLIVVLEQIVAGLCHLHGLGIIHRDIKPQNVLISETRSDQVHVLISDFGLSKSLDSGRYSVSNRTGLASTTGWKAPEIALEQSVTLKADIFSLGCVFYFTMTKGTHPFDQDLSGNIHINVHMNAAFRLTNVLSGKYSLDQLKSDDKSLAKQLIETMISQKPEERPSAEEVLKHPFFVSSEEQSFQRSSGSSKEEQDSSQVSKQTEAHAATHNAIPPPLPPGTSNTYEKSASPPSCTNNDLQVEPEGEQEKMQNMFSGAGNEESTAEKHSKSVQCELTQNDYKGSLTDPDESLRFEPNNPWALRHRGETKRLLGDYQGSLADLDESLRLEPNNAWALRQRGETKRMLKDIHGSLADLDESLSIEPNDAMAFCVRGASKRMLDDYQGSLADLDESLRLEPEDAWALSQRGATKRMLGDHQGSLADFDESLRLKPKNTWALRVRGETKRMLGDYQGSLADLDESLRLEPNNAWGLRVRGATKRMLGDYQGSLTDLDESLRLEQKDTWALCQRGETKRMLKDYKGSLADLDESLSIEPNDAMALCIRGATKRMLNDHHGSLADLNKSLSLEPKDAWTLSQRGETKRMLGDHQGPLTDFDESLRLEPNDEITLRERTKTKQMLEKPRKLSLLSEIKRRK